MTTLTPQFLLRGVAGSTAHGLATPESDEDLHGVFLWPSDSFYGLESPAESLTGHDPQDYSYHEVKKFLKLALKANPTVLELLWLETYVEKSAWGDSLIFNRHRFLSTSHVYNSYAGYAHSQFLKLQRRVEQGNPSFSSDTVKRTAKHARHLFRLLEQGKDLMTLGDMSIRVGDRQRYFDIAEMTPDQWINLYDEERPKFELAHENSVLSEKPDAIWADQWLRNLRSFT